MKSFMSMRYTLALLPALALGISTASADDTNRDRPCDEKQASVQAEKSHGQKMAEKNHDRKMAEKASKAAEHASAVAKAEAAAQAAVHESHYLASKPTGNYFSGNIVGRDVMNRRDNEIVGRVNELLIDQDGQIGAVIISTGGIMGMGKKDLAIAWDQIQRKIDGEEITLSVDFSDASLADAPDFAGK
jgi:hypothetical protein